MEEIIKIIQELREQLNSIKQIFGKLKKNTDVSDLYRNIGDSYQKIINRIKKISPQQPNFEVLRLSAKVSLLQCQLNSFELSPLTEDSVKENDNLLEIFKSQTQKLLKLIQNLNETKIKIKKKSVLCKEYRHLKKNAATLKKDWKKIEFNLKSAYYYSYAIYLLKIPTSSKLIETAIKYLEKTSYCYAQNKRKEAKLQTDKRILKTKELLKNFQSLRPVKISLNKLAFSGGQSIVRLKSSAINHLTTLSTDNTANNFKRKSLETTEQKSKKIKIHLTPRSSHTKLELHSNVTNEAIVALKKEIFSVITKNLEIKTSHSFSLTDFYGYLFHYLSYHINSKPGPKSGQDQLTCLRFADLVSFYTKLSKNFSTPEKLSSFQTQTSEINKIYAELAKVYTPLYKLRPLPFEQIMSCKCDLKSLFLNEMENYYLGQKFINDDSRKKFLNQLKFDVKKSILSTRKILITQHTLEIIDTQLNALSIELHHHCLTNCLQAIKEFYMTSDKIHHKWLEACGIPINPTHIHYQNFLGKLYHLINLFSPQGVEAIKFFNNLPKLYFFQPKKILLTKEIFLTRLKNHLLMLKKDYVSSINNYSIVCNKLTELVTNQITQSIEENQNNASNTLASIPL